MIQSWQIFRFIISSPSLEMVLWTWDFGSSLCLLQIRRCCTACGCIYQTLSILYELWLDICRNLVRRPYTSGACILIPSVFSRMMCLCRQHNSCYGSPGYTKRALWCMVNNHDNGKQPWQWETKNFLTLIYLKYIYSSISSNGACWIFYWRKLAHRM